MNTPTIDQRKAQKIAAAKQDHELLTEALQIVGAADIAATRARLQEIMAEAGNPALESIVDNYLTVITNMAQVADLERGRLAAIIRAA